MGRLRKKGEKGMTKIFISRTKAVRKLQLTLKDFRRLCILKGVYPREPPNYKKVGKGNPAKKTYYHAKDISFLSHEPLIQKFREFKIFARKLKKAEQKKNSAAEKRLLAAAPQIRLDHIIKERYPAFTDAVRDLDDSLCMLFLFAELSAAHRIRSHTLTKCRPLTDEFMQYVIRTRSLEKVFLSIKGIYYQANILGQTVTWITPYRFSMKVPTDVDFRIMDTFLHFYTTLVGFVNCKLYSMQNLHYPPKLNQERAKNDAGVSALIMEPANTAGEGSGSGSEEAGATKGAKAKKDKTAQRIASALANVDEGDGADEDEDAAADTATATAGEGEGAAAASLDSFPGQMSGGEDTVAELAAKTGANAEADKFSKLFDGLYFFLSREVPRYTLEFVIRSFGGQVSWQGMGEDDTVGRGPYAEDDKRITHHIVDRPNARATHIERHYVQPQWVYDSVNARKLHETALYAVGAILPPHLSPFVEADEDSYVPPEAKQAAKDAEAAASTNPSSAAEAGEGDESEDESDSEDEDEDEDEGDEAVYRKELETERSGGQVELAEEPAKQAAKTKKKGKAAAKGAKKASGELKELAKSMMPKKDKKLYESIMKKKDAKTAAADKLRQKRKNIDKEASKGKRKKKKTSA